MIDFFTRSQLLHSSELNRIIFETTSKELRFSKAVKISLLFKHQFRRRSYFWLLSNFNFEFRSSDEQNLINSFLFSNVNLALSLFSNITYYYQNRFLLTCEWRSLRRSLHIENVSYFHRYSVFDDDLNRYLLKSFDSASTANKIKFVVDITYRWTFNRPFLPLFIPIFSNSHALFTRSQALRMKRSRFAHFSKKRLLFNRKKDSFSINFDFD